MRGTNPRHFVRQPVAQSHRAVKTKYVDGYFKKEQVLTNGKSQVLSSYYNYVNQS